jgi:hypothetical protein
LYPREALHPAILKEKPRFRPNTYVPAKNFRDFTAKTAHFYDSREHFRDSRAPLDLTPRGGHKDRHGITTEGEKDEKARQGTAGLPAGIQN